ncbi:hypothetical protein BCR39DRAFT_535012 [Naematelia encephala]|uniref:Uncharacterized protein n=1 Tax=Naematelia encephala TaxID=71784 RepID=A0A1Y2B189_9TREE|nr:hypothetical protein BCR39DRAFT_535012 [Naematelia encephala]
MSVPSSRIRKQSLVFSNAPTMPITNGQPPRGGSSMGPPPHPNGSTPPMVNGRRMTSNSSLPPGYINGDGPQPPYMPAAAGIPRPPSTTAPPTSYPWSTRPIRLYAPQTSPPAVPQSPFPRYGLSVPAFPSHSGHMLIFGGLVHDIVKNDLWSMDVRDCTTMPVKTKGDAPMGRVGHAAAIADRIMLIWGGDTKVLQDDKQDEGLYILDLRTQEWTAVPVAPGPVGRYGHAACMHDTRFFVFGGQADGAFMSDLWAYDIKQLSGDAQHTWEKIQYTTPPPPPRTGHVLVSHQGKLLLFGGTDGNYHYNDTWSFDLSTGEWTELSCIGYIPVPREGHAAAVVDDVVYIFGGRDVNGKDLGDLAAFRITNQRWYMFQNMGPSPTARSGHAMVAAHGKIFVVGGEANTTSGTSRDDPSLVHVLDTTKIKYPPDTQPPRQMKPRPSDPAVPSQAGREASSPQVIPPSDTPQSVRRQLPPSSSIDSLARAASPPTSGSSDRLAQLAQAPIPLAAPIEGQLPRSVNGAPPQRPRREGDEEFRRAMSPTGMNGPPSPSQNGFPVRVTSPTGGQGPASPPHGVKNGFNASVLGTRSPSPRLRMTDNGDRPAPPPDAFYYGRSPTGASFSPRPNSMSGSADIMRELKAKEAEVEAGKKREAALRVIIGKAVHQGYITEDDEQPEQPNGDSTPNDEVVRKLADALVRLKQEKAAIQTELVTQMRLASDKAMNAERLRRGALQEAAFFRAKVATLESNSPIDLSRIEKERINELEKQLGALSMDHTSVRRDLERASAEAAANKGLHNAAVDREAETLRRAEDAEDAHRSSLAELEELQSRSGTTENSFRELTERSITLSSTAQQREAERDHLQSQLDEAIAARDEQVGLIEQAQAAIAAAGLRADEMEALYNKSTLKVHALEEEMAELKTDLEVKTREAELSAERMSEIENAYAKSREEADSLRTVTTSRLGELLDSHKEMRADETRVTRGHQEQLRALEEEGKALRKMLREAGQRLDAAEGGVAHHRQKARDLEAAQQTLRGDIRGHRTKAINAQSELTKYREIQATKDAELQEKDMAITEIETRCAMLRNLLADHGIAVNDNDLASAEASSTRELETKLRERTRAHETSQREVEELQRRCAEAEDKVESLGRLVDRIKDARSPTSTSMRSPTPPHDTDQRVFEAERKMSEMESSHKEKLAALEGDYQTAVRYVKGTEKMLKRMKDELNKQKSANSSLQTEIDGLRGRSSTEPGARTRDASGRAAPSSNEAELSRRLDKLQNQHNAIQAELGASRDVLVAREREVDVLRMRCEEAEREVEVLRADLEEAKHRINTLLDMNQSGVQLGSEDESDEMQHRRGSNASSEEASMAFDNFSKKLEQWKRTRSPQAGDETEDDDTAHLGAPIGIETGQGQGQGQEGANATTAHKRHTSDYSGDWTQ